MLGGSSLKIDKRTFFHIFLAALGCIAFYWLLHEPDRVKAFWEIVSNIFMPFVVGAVLAFILNVPMRGIESLLKFIKGEKLKRIISIVLTFAAVGVVMYGVVMLLIPQVEETIDRLLMQLPLFFENVYKNVMKFLEERPELLEWANENFHLQDLNWSSIIEKAATMVSESLTKVVTGAISAVSSLASGIFNAVISLVFSLYCLARKETLARQGRKLVYSLLAEARADETIRICRMTNSAFSNFITGQCLEAVILGLLFVPFMAIFKMPYIPLICVVITVTALVPLVGAFAGCILGAFFILVNDPMQAIGFVIMFLAIQQFEGNVIYPRVVGSSIGLPGMWVLLAVAVGGGLWGVGGMFLMVPIASVIYTLIRERTAKRLEGKNIDPQKLVEQPPELQSHFVMKAKNAKKKAQARREVRVERREERREERKSKKNKDISE
jgi:predicted PurR-regulated permease PerM